MENSQFQIQILQSKDIQPCVSTLCKSFSQIQLIKSLQISSKSLQPLMIQACQLGVKRNLSVVMKSKKTLQLIGCFISSDMYDQKYFMIQKLDKSVKPYLNFLNSISGQFLQQNKVYQQQGKWVNMWDMVIMQPYRGKGLAKYMRDYSMNMFKQKGYKYGFAELISPQTQRSFLYSTNYFKLIKSIQYKDFIHEGTHLMPYSLQNAVSVYSQLDKVNIKSQFIL